MVEPDWNGDWGGSYSVNGHVNGKWKHRINNAMMVRFMKVCSNK